MCSQASASLASAVHAPALAPAPRPDLLALLCVNCCCLPPPCRVCLPKGLQLDSLVCRCPLQPVYVGLARALEQCRSILWLYPLGQSARPGRQAVRHCLRN